MNRHSCSCHRFICDILQIFLFHWLKIILLPLLIDQFDPFLSFHWLKINPLWLVSFTPPSLSLVENIILLLPLHFIGWKYHLLSSLWLTFPLPSISLIDNITSLFLIHQFDPIFLFVCWKYYSPSSNWSVWPIFPFLWSLVSDWSVRPFPLFHWLKISRNIILFLLIG